MTETVPQKGFSVGEDGKSFINSCVFNYGLPTYIIADKRKQITSKILHRCLPDLERSQLFHNYRRNSDECPSGENQQDHPRRSARVHR